MVHSESMMYILKQTIFAWTLSSLSLQFAACYRVCQGTKHKKYRDNIFGISGFWDFGILAQRYFLGFWGLKFLKNGISGILGFFLKFRGKFFGSKNVVLGFSKNFEVIFSGQKGYFWDFRVEKMKKHEWDTGF